MIRHDSGVSAQPTTLRQLALFAAWLVFAASLGVLAVLALAPHTIGGGR